MKTGKYNRQLNIISLIALLLIMLPSLVRGVAPNVSPRILTLQQVIEMALQQSPESKDARNRLENAFWSYRNYKTSFRPTLNLSGNLPDFNSTNTPITQPDGSVIFRNINLSQSSALLSLNQEIAATGATIYAATNLMRIDDFEKHTLAYSSSPFLIGLKQPVFGFNSKQWTKKIEPLRWEESQKYYDEQTEQISYTATQLFFDLLSIFSPKYISRLQVVTISITLSPPTCKTKFVSKSFDLRFYSIKRRRRELAPSLYAVMLFCRC
jgi:hypothetical protein